MFLFLSPFLSHIRSPDERGEKNLFSLPSQKKNDDSFLFFFFPSKILAISVGDQAENLVASLVLLPKTVG